MKRRLFTILISMLLLLLSFSTAASPSVSRAEASMTKKILGYYNVYYTGDKNSYNSLAAYHSYINAISTMTFSVDATGAIVGTMPTDALSLSASYGIQPYAAIKNEQPTGFSPDLAHAILTDNTLRQTTINNIVKLVQENGYKGANIDFENMYAADRPYYTQFVQELATTLRPLGYETIVSVTAKTADAPTAAWSGAFDYAALGAAADYVQVMTYDQNGPWSAPGPVAGLNWVEKVVQYAVSTIPSSKILIGLPAYGYDWNTTTNTGHKSVAWKNVPSLLTTTGATSKWDATSSSPTFTYTAADGSSHTVWYENSESIQLKTQLVNKYNLAGVSVWCLRLEDEAFWKAVQAGLGQTVSQPVTYATSTSVAVGKAVYRAGETVTLTVKAINQDGKPLGGAAVTMTLTSPTGAKTTTTGTTDTTGTKVFSVATNKKTAKGTYQVQIHTTYPNYTSSSATTSYIVQ